MSGPPGALADDHGTDEQAHLVDEVVVGLRSMSVVEATYSGRVFNAAVMGPAEFAMTPQ